jgi:hypothetical protein
MFSLILFFQLTISNDSLTSSIDRSIWEIISEVKTDFRRGRTLFSNRIYPFVKKVGMKFLTGRRDFIVSVQIMMMFAWFSSLPSLADAGYPGAQPE